MTIPSSQPLLKAYNAQQVRQQRISNGKYLFDELIYFKTDEAVSHHLLRLTFLKSWTLLSCEAQHFLSRFLTTFNEKR